MEESSIIFKKSLCVTSLSSGTQQSSSKEPLNRLEARRHQSAAEKLRFVSGLHSAEPAPETAPACHIYKYMSKSIKSDFNWVLNLPERRASFKVWKKNKDLCGQINLEPGSRGSQHRSRKCVFFFIVSLSEKQF